MLLYRLAGQSHLVSRASEHASAVGQWIPLTLCQQFGIVCDGTIGDLERWEAGHQHAYQICHAQKWTWNRKCRDDKGSTGDQTADRIRILNCVVKSDQAAEAVAQYE